MYNIVPCFRVSKANSPQGGDGNDREEARSNHRRV
jgi:hypothetical protein